MRITTTERNLDGSDEVAARAVFAIRYAQEGTRLMDTAPMRRARTSLSTVACPSLLGLEVPWPGPVRVGVRTA